MDGRAPASLQRLPNATDVYCLGPTGHRNTGLNGLQRGVEGLCRRPPAELLWQGRDLARNRVAHRRSAAPRPARAGPFFSRARVAVAVHRRQVQQHGEPA